MCARPRKSSLRPNKITAYHTGLARDGAYGALKLRWAFSYSSSFAPGSSKGGPWKRGRVESTCVRGMKTASVAYSVADKEQGKKEDWGEKSKIREVSAGSSGLVYS